MKVRKLPSKERIREKFSYNPETGIMKRRIDAHKGRFKAGEEVGSWDKHGYLTVFMDGKAYKLHRVAWVYIHGSINGEIDHINGDRSDNRLSNLREAGRSEQNANAKLHAHNTTGHKGVYRHTNKPGYWAFIEWKRKRIWLGSYPTFEEAVKVRKKAEEKYFGEFARSA